MDYQTRIYKQAMKLYERMSPEQQKEEEDALIAQGHTSDEDKTMAFVEKFTNPELFQAAITKARPNTLQEVGGALSAGLGAYGAGLAGRDPTAAGSDIYDRFRDVADRPVKNLEDDQKRIQEWIATNMKVGKATSEERRAQSAEGRAVAGEGRAAAGEERKIDKFDLEYFAADRMNDPESDVSNDLRKMATAAGLGGIGKDKKPIPVSDGTTAAELETLFDNAEKAGKLAGKGLTAWQIYQQKRHTKMDERHDTERKEDTDRKLKDKKDKQKAELAKRSEGFLSVQNALDDVASYIKDMRSEEEIRNGKSVLQKYSEMAEANDPDTPDIGGFNILWFGPRVTELTPEARKVRGAVQTFFNQRIKEQSGAAVTVPEYERLKREFNTGGLSTEREMFMAMARAEKAIQAGLANARAGFPDTSISYRTGEGGSLGSTPSKSTAAPAPAEEMVRVITKDGRRGSIPASKLDAFIKAGGIKAQ